MEVAEWRNEEVKNGSCQPCEEKRSWAQHTPYSASPHTQSPSSVSGRESWSPRPRSYFDTRDYTLQIGEPIVQSSFQRSFSSPQQAMDCEALYEMDTQILETQQQMHKEYAVSLKSNMGKTEIMKKSVMEHFHSLMKDTLGERMYTSLLKKGVLSKNLPDEIVTRKIVDALELKNKLLFAGDSTSSTLDKMGLIHAAGSFRGALRAAANATTSVDDDLLEEVAEQEVLNYEGVYAPKNKPHPEIKVIGYIGLTNNQ